ncbi:hypothetical protein Rhopal_004944-T1 [Rhodotorula paludigena]|uniref:Uncharacterized protein n=1 Tax=Rhodotorula paludigena TaxID=86838 RepID=A0AAV5GPS0_9BASI|nr:hypothetical protein Rhopal_004944-T1 [Rhodotorula paludigena]
MKSAKWSNVQKCHDKAKTTLEKQWCGVEKDAWLTQSLLARLQWYYNHIQKEHNRNKPFSERIQPWPGQRALEADFCCVTLDWSGIFVQARNICFHYEQHGKHAGDGEAAQVWLDGFHGDVMQYIANEDFHKLSTEISKVLHLIFTHFVRGDVTSATISDGSFQFGHEDIPSRDIRLSSICLIAIVKYAELKGPRIVLVLL